MRQQDPLWRMLFTYLQSASMSNYESLGEDDLSDHKSFLRLLLHMPSCSNADILRHSLSEYTYNVSDRDSASSSLAGSELELSCR